MNPTTIYHTTKKAYHCLIAHYEWCPTRSMQLPLIECWDFTGTSQPMLGVLFFPLSLPSRNGATHTIQRFRLAPSSPHKDELPLFSELGIPTPTSKSVNSIFLQHNVTQTKDDCSSFSFLHLIEFQTFFLS